MAWGEPRTESLDQKIQPLTRTRVFQASAKRQSSVHESGFNPIHAFLVRSCWEYV